MIPARFVWTRFGAESGEVPDAILRRKERERLLGHGVFLWGIGNSVGSAVRRLLADGRGTPQVIFSPMLGPARRSDHSPSRVVVWRRGLGLDGREWIFPLGAMVTSRLDTKMGTKRRHFALVCCRAEPIASDPNGDRFALSDLANLGSRRPVGSSQVTAVVTRVGCGREGAYVASMHAELRFPYVLELFEPVEAASSQESVAVGDSGRAVQFRIGV